MAEGFLFDFIEKLIGKLGSMVVEAWNVRDDVEKLVENMSEIKAVILDAEEQQQQQGNNSHQVQLWLEKLKDVLDDAEDLLDDFSNEDKRRKVDNEGNKVRIFFSLSNPLILSIKMSQKINELRKRIEVLNVDRKTFNFTTRTPVHRVVRETHSFIREEEVIGREREKKELIDLLLNPNPDFNENVSVISIIGIGGLGKTALAQLVYNDEVVQQHFELKMWVCVADDSDVRGFDVKVIAAKILKSNSNDEMEKVQRELRKKVKGNRYLLVLDDIWNEEREHWLRLKTLLVDGAKGSKIIVTTRSEKVAMITDTSSLVFLKGLDEEKSLRLFSQLAFENGKIPENPNLLSIGKEIVKKCSGVPLAIRSIGSSMYSVESEKDWSNFKDKDLVKIDEQGGNKVFQLIKLSYDHLPIPLKKCFAFCSLFPKDKLFQKKMLIRLWIAQGFVHSSDGSISLEDTGSKYFMTLVHRSFLQYAYRDNFGDEFFKMHDLVHDLARFISGNGCVRVNKKVKHIDKRTRHVSFVHEIDISSPLPNCLLKAYKLRTILFKEEYSQLNYWCDFDGSQLYSACNMMISSCKQLRVLDLNNFYIRKIPPCIDMLKHLRYLDICENVEIEELPQSITNLSNLETLLLNGCSKLRELPKDIRKLTSLRHLEFKGCNKLTFLPHGIGQLTNLQTLTQFMFDTTSTHSAGANELRKLCNLRGDLEIKGFECLRCSEEAIDINLMGMSHLQKLTLTWAENDGDDNDNDKKMKKDDIIVQGLLLPPNIKDLELTRFGGVRLSFSSSVNSATNLNTLKVSDCTRLQYLPQLHVKCLQLSDLPSLEWIVSHNGYGSSSTFSPSLTDISLYYLPNLKGWCRCSEEEIERGCCHRFRSLDRLRIGYCKNLISIPRHTNIKRIHVSRVREKILKQLVYQSKVESLSIHKIEDLKSLSGVLQHITAVVSLHILDCYELDLCDDEEGSYSMQWKELKNLKELRIYSNRKMVYFPEGLGHVTTLQSLRIVDCHNLNFLPEWVTSLQDLEVAMCPNLCEPLGVRVRPNLIQLDLI